MFCAGALCCSSFLNTSVKPVGCRARNDEEPIRGVSVVSALALRRDSVQRFRCAMARRRSLVSYLLAPPLCRALAFVPRLRRATSLTASDLERGTEGRELGCLCHREETAALIATLISPRALMR
ncbi:hypothetical protein AAFF_G00042050 [Aldrovandia affinis]|uniref:Uncharacterized protein n=1 Tax=Aldrovandia affinis TaxID=143900 RepID=A0AAD7S2T2_9TELE|nr:hypothetical protein AAFF_G00042050 [Aldrovandia affinis]